MTATVAIKELNALRAEYEQDGYAVARSLFAPDEVSKLRNHYMRLREVGSYPGDMVAEVPKEGDPLLRYPRLIHMHRWDEASLGFLLDVRIKAALTALLGAEPFAVQTMLYFKPPGARGQALHQDQFYLRAQPGTCIAAWLALDTCDDANGCMRVVPGSHTWPVLCPEKADTNASFTNVTVPLPPDVMVAPVHMQPGDVLFFNGQLVHGSLPNTTEDRFRRSLIGHYVTGESTRVTEFVHPVLRMDGSVVSGMAPSPAGGGACGVWVDKNGAPVIELTGKPAVTAPAHE